MSQKTVLITGASSGIGLAAARALAARGERLILLGRSQARLEAAAGDLGATLIEADVGDPESLRRAAERVGGLFERLDVLVNNAGQFELGRAEALGSEVAERLMRVNYLGTVRAIELFLPLLRRAVEASGTAGPGTLARGGAVIVNVASIAGRVAPPFMAPYAASKFAVVGYTRSLRQELAGEGIHVGLVLPGPVSTPMIEGKIGTAQYPRMAGVPVVSAEATAAGILRVIDRRRAEVVVPRRLGLTAMMAGAFPGLVDVVYRWYVKL